MLALRVTSVFRIRQSAPLREILPVSVGANIGAFTFHNYFDSVTTRPTATRSNCKRVPSATVTKIV